MVDMDAQKQAVTNFFTARLAAMRDSTGEEKEEFAIRMINELQKKMFPDSAVVLLISEHPKPPAQRAGDTVLGRSFVAGSNYESDDKDLFELLFHKYVTEKEEQEEARIAMEDARQEDEEESSSANA